MGAEWIRRCARCEAPLETGSKHPVHADHGGDGVRLSAFCDEACKTAWLADPGVARRH